MDNTVLLRTLNEKGISAYRLSKRMGISPCITYNILNRKTTAYPKFQRTVAEILEEPISYLFDERGMCK